MKVESGGAEEKGHRPDQAQRLLSVSDRPDRLRAHREHHSQVPKAYNVEIYIFLVLRIRSREKLFLSV